MPINLLERFKQFYWKLFEPIFPTVRDIWVALGLIKHAERQLYPLGWLKHETGEREARKLLEAAGFSNDYLGWIDPDEILNMRKVVEVVYQYHVRIFSDGEVRGHYEFTPESHPFKHLFERGMLPADSYFKPLLAPVLAERPWVRASRLNPK